MKKRSKITISIVIFVILVLFIFILQTKIIVSADSNLSINRSNDKNLEFNVMPAQVGRVESSGSARLPEQPKKFKEAPLKNINAEVKEEQVEEVQTNISKINDSVKYDPEILEAFNNNSEIPVIVRLKDKSNINIVGTKEERRNLSIQRYEWFKPVVDEVLATLPENDFDGEGTSTGLVGFITKNGFQLLLNDSRVSSITWTKYGVQTSLDDTVPLINADDVWNLGYTGSGVKVCVIDSGADASHSALTGKIIDDHCYCRTPGDGYDYCCPPDHSRESDDATDDNGHGTHVTGIVASQDSTYKGVAYDVDIYVVKVLNSSGGGKPPWIWADLQEAIKWCTINKSVDIITMSFGDGKEYGPSGQHGSCPDNLGPEITDAYNAGISVIIASGNQGYTNGISDPACSPNAISVGATTKSDTMAWFTNRGSNLDLLAPGGYSILSGSCPTNYWICSTQLGGGFIGYSGTSMATPHVSGAAALLLNAKSSLNPDQIETALKNTGKSIQSWKRINVSAALNYVCDVDGDDYLSEPCSGGNDCDDSDSSIHPGATEVCDGIDNDCDDTVDEGCGEVQECEESGYEWCIEYEDENCDVSIAMNVYDNVNDINWGNVNDGWDPYVIDEYTIGWKDREAEEMYYDIDDPNSACTDDEGYCQGGCDGEQIADTGTRVTVTAPGTAHFEEVLGYDEDGDYCCWVWYYAFNPNYGGSNPIYVLNCFDNDDCSANQYCDKSGDWDDWDCVNKKSDGQSCTEDYQCLSGYCDNDGVGLSDDGWCLTPYNTYFDGQETTYCEYSTNNGIEDCDERQTGADLDKCIGTSYYEEECSSTCTYQDVTSVFECTDSGCSCTTSECDGIAPQGTINYCNKEGQTYFQDDCGSTATAEDTNSICRSASSLQSGDGCTADAECNGITAGTTTQKGSCSATCVYDAFPNVTLVYPSDNNISTTGNMTFNCSASDDFDLDNITLYHNMSGIWQTNETKTLTGTSDFEIFTINNIPDNTNFIWNCLAYDNASQSGWGNTNYTVGVNIPQSNITINSLQSIYSNNTHHTFEFIILNNGDTAVNSISWQFDTDDNNIINSTINISSLAVNEKAFVYLQYNYSSTGDFNVNASATGLSQSEMITGSLTSSVTIGDLVISSFDNVSIDGLDVIFESVVNNNLETENITNINWSLTTDDGEIINATQLFDLNPNESIFIYTQHQYSSGGTYNPIFAVSNEAYSDSESTEINLATTSMSFFEGWESGSITRNWSASGDPGTYDRQQVDTSSSTCTTIDPRTGTYMLRMDVTTNGNYETNIIKTMYDFSGASNIVLDFYHADNNDEETTCSDHTGLDSNCDGYFFTCDGNQWYELGELGNVASGTWQNANVDISNDPDFCQTVNSSFAIKFTQYDNYACNSDGRLFDDINITYDISS